MKKAEWRRDSSQESGRRRERGTAERQRLQTEMGRRVTSPWLLCSRPSLDFARDKLS